MNLPNLGIIAGRGKLPSDIARSYIAKDGRVFIAAIEQAAEVALLQDYQYEIFKIGQAGAVIDYFTKNAVEEIVIIGGIDRPNLFDIRVDKDGALLLAQIIKNKFLGDDQLLKTVAVYLEQKGFKIISPKTILSGTVDLNTIVKPSCQHLDDITVGYKTASLLGELDIGQSVIVENGYILGLEGAEGTDNLIARCAILRKKSSGGVLVKIVKKQQDTRLDLPTIGLKTIELLSLHKYDGLAIDHQTQIVDATNTYLLADKLGVFIHVV